MDFFRVWDLGLEQARLATSITAMTVQTALKTWLKGVSDCGFRGFGVRFRCVRLPSRVWGFGVRFRCLPLAIREFLGGVGSPER